MLSWLAASPPIVQHGAGWQQCSRAGVVWKHSSKYLFFAVFSPWSSCSTLQLQLKTTLPSNITLNLNLHLIFELNLNFA